MSLSILQNGGDVHSQPYPHIVIEDCLPKDLYDELEATRPSDDYIVDGRPFGSNMRMDLHAQDLLTRMNVRELTMKKPPDIWKQFIRYHLSNQFLQEVVALFNSELGPGSAFAKLMMHQTGKPWARFPVTIRTQPPSRTAISMDVNVGVNTPVVGKASSVRGPHVDNPIELFAAMLYMPPKGAEDEGGDFVIYAKSRPVRFVDKAEVHPHDALTLSEHARVKYKRNTMVAFINSVHAIHGVTPRLSRDFRRLVNFIIELPFAQFTLPR